MPSTHQETANAQKYQRGRLNDRFIQRFRRSLTGRVVALSPASILDVGCGEGIVTAWLAEAAPDARIEGVDGRAEAIEEFGRRNPSLRGTIADLYSLPFEDASFDLVVATEVLEHLEAPERALAELARVAGHVLVTVPHEPFFSLGNLALGRYVRRFGNTPGHLNRWGRRGLLRLARAEPGEVEWFGAFPWQGAIVRHRAPSRRAAHRRSRTARNTDPEGA